MQEWHYKELKVAFEERGEARPGEPALLLLHGWGGQAASFAPVTERLSQSHKVYALDLPGFGTSDPPAEVWGVEEYSACVERFMQDHGLQAVCLVGHSNGGRISIYLAAHLPHVVKKLVLVDSAGLIPKRTLKYYVKVYTYKALKRFAHLPFLPGTAEARREWVQGLFGSQDYRNAGILRSILVKTVNQDLRPLLSRIQAPTLLVWGEEDRDTPLYMAEIMRQEIPDAGLVVFEEAGHFSYLEQTQRFCVILEHFLQD